MRTGSNAIIISIKKCEDRLACTPTSAFHSEGIVLPKNENSVIILSKLSLFINHISSLA